MPVLWQKSQQKPRHCFTIYSNPPCHGPYHLESFQCTYKRAAHNPHKERYMIGMKTLRELPRMVSDQLLTKVKFYHNIHSLC
ncbi:hypothetical protein WA026_010213 [Henosepilachna vigintioctopunctata]|uniref:Uncharacterized protein n=1 Tax=Henosepilachna vigintioctopunctata TaxID=420089 RepID=A0AAW1UCF7_9CUCU